VVSVTEKAHEMRQVGTEKANVSEPLLKCRKRIDDIETGVQLFSRDEPGGYLFTALREERVSPSALSAACASIGASACGWAARRSVPPG